MATKTKTVIVNWRKETDDGYPRRRVFEIKIPVTGETTPLEDEILSLPLNRLDTRVVEPLTGEPSDEICVQAIRGALAEEKSRQEEFLTRNLFAYCEGRRSYFNSHSAKELFEENTEGKVSVESDLSEEARKWLSPKMQERVPFLRQTLFNQKVEELIQEGQGVEQGFLFTDQETKDILLAQEKAEAKSQEAKRKAKEEGKSRKAEKEAKKQAQIKVRKAWAEEHGSPRLKMQLAQGYDGWPLFLHEKLQHDFARLGFTVELDNNGEDTDVINPTEGQLFAIEEIADFLANHEMANDIKSAFSRIRIVQITFDSDEYDDYNEHKAKVYAVVEDYIPAEHHTSKRIRFLLESNSYFTG